LSGPAATPPPPWDPDRDLPAPCTLRLYRGDAVLFASQGRWLHPLFDLEAFLAERAEDPAGTRLVDRVTGRAAAFLVARLGIPRLDTLVLSRRALDVLERFGVRHRHQVLVDRVLCTTEDLLGDVQDPEAAWALLRERRARALARPGSQ